MKLSLLVAILLSVSCTDPADPAQTENGMSCDARYEKLSSGERQAIEEAKHALPEHALYVDKCGDFNVRKAAKTLWETGNYESPSQAVTRANEMELEWLQEVGTRMDEIA